jgi:hypothetical protein
MVIEVLAAHTRAAMRIRIVAPAVNARVCKVLREEVAEPVDAIARRPRLLSVSVEAMDGNDA